MKTVLLLLVILILTPSTFAQETETKYDGADSWTESDSSWMDSAVSAWSDSVVSSQYPREYDKLLSFHKELGEYFQEGLGYDRSDKDLDQTQNREYVLQSIIKGRTALWNCMSMKRIMVTFGRFHKAIPQQVLTNSDGDPYLSELHYRSGISSCQLILNQNWRALFNSIVALEHNISNLQSAAMVSTARDARKVMKDAIETMDGWKSEAPSSTDTVQSKK